MENKRIEIKKDEVAVCTAEYLAEKLGVSTRHVYALRAKGILSTIRTNRGMRYDIANSLIGLAEHYKAKKAEKASGGRFSLDKLYSVDEEQSRLASYGIIGVDLDLLRIAVCINALMSADPAQTLETFADDYSGALYCGRQNAPS